MKNFYEIGPIYIWISETIHKGKECIVTSDVGMHGIRNDGSLYAGQMTDTKNRHGVLLCAGKGCLRPKNPPTGEKMIYEMFTNPMIIDLEETV